MSKLAIVLTVSFLAYLVQGLNDGALGVAWPSIRYELYIPLEFAGFLTITGFTSYSFVASQFGRLSKLFFTPHLVLAGILLIVTANVGLFFAPNFFALIVCIAVVAAGQGLIESNVSAYLARHFTARHVNWGLCFWGMGASVGPVIMSQMIQGFNWRWGYVAILAIQSVVGLLAIYSIKSGAWVNKGVVSRELKTDMSTTKVKLSYQMLQMTVFFLSSGTQTAFGFWITTVMIESRGLSVEAAGLYPAFYFGSIMAGRIVFGGLAKDLGNMALIRIGLVMAVGGIAMLIFSTSLIGAMLVGFGMGPVFPCLVHETTRRFSPDVLDRQMGYQLSAAGFGEIISSSLGLLLSFVSLEILFPVALGLILLVFVINELVEVQVKKLSL